MRQCSRCKIIKDISEFRKRKNTYQSWCRDCERDYNSRYIKRRRNLNKTLGLCLVCLTNTVSRKNGKTCNACLKKKNNQLSNLYKRRPELKLLYSARARSKKHSIPFNISIDDISIPEVCPILGIKLEKGDSGYCSPGSPTIDRFIPELGYVKNNITVISHRANTIKSNATIEEIEKILAWMKLKLSEIGV